MSINYKEILVDSKITFTNSDIIIVISEANLIQLNKAIRFYIKKLDYVNKWRNNGCINVETRKYIPPKSFYEKDLKNNTILFAYSKVDFIKISTCISAYQKKLADDRRIKAIFSKKPSKPKFPDVSYILEKNYFLIIIRKFYHLNCYK